MRTQFIKIISALVLGYWATGALGDFHVSLIVQYSSAAGVVNDLTACPSDYWNCECYANGVRAGYIPQGDGAWSPPSFFSIENLCGESQLNFYQNGNSWNGYINNGDGSVVATCYPGDNYPGTAGSGPALDCNAWYIFYDTDNQVWDQLVCYSYICNP